MRKVGFIFYLAVVFVLAGLAFVTQTDAQTRPYVGYRIYGGCLYITPQGYAVIGQMVPGGSCQ